MNLIEYYIELCSKPEYLLSSSEKFFVEMFIPMCLFLLIVSVVVIDWTVSAIKERRKKNVRK